MVEACFARWVAESLLRRSGWLMAAIMWLRPALGKRFGPARLGSSLNLIQPVQTDGPNIFRHGKGVSPGVNDVERIQLEIVQRRLHRRCHPWRHHPLDLETSPSSTRHDKQVKLGASVGGPVMALFGARV